MNEMGLTNLVFEGSQLKCRIKKVRLSERLNSHAQLCISLTIKKEGEEERGDPVLCGGSVALKEVTDSVVIVIFSGVVRKTVMYWDEDTYCADVTAESYSSLLDRYKRRRSFQMESRTYGELFQLILSQYDSGAYIWNGSEKFEAVGQFLLQYCESDWEFLKRMASRHRYTLIPEIEVPGVKLYIGPLRERKEVKISCMEYHKEYDYQSMEILIRIIKSNQNIELGAPAEFMGGHYIASEKVSKTCQGEWLHDYILIRGTGCRNVLKRTVPIHGLSLSGSVASVRLGQVQLKLETDREGEKIESWHIQPVYYAGAGMGYGGTPEIGDTLQLYFSTDDENERYIIGSCDAGMGRLCQCANSGEGDQSAALSETKSLTTPGGLGLALNQGGICVYSKGQSGKVMIKNSRILVSANGDISLRAKQLKGMADGINVEAGDYIWMHCGNDGVLVTKEEIQLKGGKVNIFSPANEACKIINQDAVGAVLSEYGKKRKKGMEFFEADGSLRVFGEGDTEAEKNVRIVIDYIKNSEADGAFDQYDVEIDEYHTYSQVELDSMRKRDSVFFNATGFIGPAGTALSVMGQYAQDEAYSDNYKDTFQSLGWAYGPGLLKNYFTPNLPANGVSFLATAVYTGKSIISDAKGQSYLAEYHPYGASKVLYGDDRYFINNNDVFVKIGIKDNGEYIGTYNAYLSKGSLLGDPKEIKALWYYGNTIK